jgi:hypothetical protein
MSANKRLNGLTLSHKCSVYSISPDSPCKGASGRSFFIEEGVLWADTGDRLIDLATAAKEFWLIFFLRHAQSYEQRAGLSKQTGQMKAFQKSSYQEL